MKLNFNYIAMKGYKAYKKNNIKHSKSINNVSTGKVIRSAKDNPNQVSKLGNFEKEIRGYQSSRRNIQDTVSMIQSADTVMGSVTERISRIRELTVNAGSGAIDKSQKEILQKEINSLVDGIDKEIKNYSFNGVNVLGNENVKNNSKHEVVDVLSGVNTENITKIPSYNLSTEVLGIKDINVVDKDIGEVLEKLDKAATDVTKARTSFGAIQNTLEDEMINSKTLEESVTSSKSIIEDADIAAEMVEYTRTLMLTEANVKNMSKSIYFPTDIINAIGRLYK